MASKSENVQSQSTFKKRHIKIAAGNTLVATPVFDTYWRFATMRQDIFMQRVVGEQPPFTTDPVLSVHRFTNAYRASDRVSQYLIRNVLYDGDQSTEEVFFRAMLFKIFNRIDTWETLNKKIGFPTWKTYKFEQYARVFDEIMDGGKTLYSAAYIMPSPAFGNPRKHRNHLRLIEYMMKNKLPKQVANAKTLSDVFNTLLDCPSLGAFLAFQFTIDLNYSSIIDFPESQFVVAGPGAKDGIRKCFADTGGLTEAEVIHAVTEMADAEFKRLGLSFKTLWGRPLQPIDCQNIFCEVDKYARVMHPEFIGNSGRSRIKQKFHTNFQPLPQWYPPKWKLKLPKKIVSAIGDDLSERERVAAADIMSAL
ncbi:MAG: nucleotide kinase domain-containing protein [Bdellovibrionota bacterium]